MSIAYKVTVVTLIVTPLGLLILYLIMAGSYCDKDNLSTNDSDNSPEFASDCRVSSWSKWSNCTCLVENYRYRRRTLESNYNWTIHKIDPCADIDTMQYIKCEDSECGKVDYCNETIEYDSLLESSYNCNSSDDNIIEFYYFNPIEFSCSLIKLKDCIDHDIIQNKFPSIVQCEKICFFQNYFIGDV